ncbi:MAG TPA: mannose-1-phosphate guanylyltransferase [Gemmatimonadaceae bacterium]|nr:mannose-1-phosphate guanylyltransferase [Gemmatimonadaceae bacterium]
MSQWAVILAGGVGSRFWPLSTPRRPKQLLPLVDDDPLLVDAVRRVLPLVCADHVLVITSAALAPAVRTALPELPRENVLAEPRPAGTGPALAWAAAEIVRRGGGGALMLSTHADWAIGDAEAFRATLVRAAGAAGRHRGLVTVGIVPSRPDPGFGYIQPGGDVDGARRVARFVEKPDRATAERMVRDGYLWNSGIFAWRAGDFLDEVRAHAPEIAGALPLAEGGEPERFFEAVQPISVDQGVLERSTQVLVLPGDFGWDDVGTWAALRRVRRLDVQGNAISGAAYPVDARDNVVHAEGDTVVLYGVSNLVVVTRDGLTLVTTVDRAAHLKELLAELPAAVRDAP